MTTEKSKIIWTKIDEAPALASYSLLPIVNSFIKYANIEVETADISLAGRIIANFSEYLKENQKTPDYLNKLGELTMKEDTNIIKLPNISATIPQLKEAIKELQKKGYAIPDYPKDTNSENSKELSEKFAKILGSAVNPVLRQGNSDRRSSKSVKEFAKKNPHKMMKPWEKSSKTHVSFMDSNDFYGNEKSIVTPEAIGFKIIFVDKNGNEQILKDGLKSSALEVLDGTFMSKNSLRKFYEEQINEAKEQNILFSLHLKATMMKVSDPIMFGYAVEVFYKEIIEKYKNLITELGVNFDNGIDDLYKKIKILPEDKQKEIEKDILELYKTKPELAMVDTEKGITNLHIPNNIIIDASMPVVIRDGGKMYGTDGKLKETKAVIPDRCYSTIYQEVIENCKQFGQFNPATMGSVSNVGLMAQKAEEYGSHPTTFKVPEDGFVRVVDENNNLMMEHIVEKGDIWRMSRVKDIPVQDWVKLAVNRAKVTGTPAIFWLDNKRAHDARIIEKVKKYLEFYDLNGLEIKILSPDEAMRYTLQRTREGKDTISVTGNVLRDYLTDLFPILELGTSARMLSIVPLLNGGGLFETGAGGSAPKHVQQFLEEGHLRWDSLGEFLAIQVSLEHLGNKYNNQKALVLAKTLDEAIGKYLENQKSPSRNAGELDNRGTHFFLAQYWAKALSLQNEDFEFKEKFTKTSEQLIKNEDVILKEIADAEGKPTNIGGYYKPDDELAQKAMRPSETFNRIINSI